MENQVAILILGGIAVTGAISFVWNLNRCNHHWEHVDKEVIPPAIDTEHAGEYQYWLCDLPRLLQTKVIIVIGCKKCGAHRVIREQNP